jgi:hypothetical protein
MAEKQHSTLAQGTQGALQVIRLRMTIALLRRAIADKSADSDLLFRVADLACQAFRDLAQAAKTEDAKERLWRAWHACWWALKYADEGMTDLAQAVFEDAIAAIVA